MKTERNILIAFMLNLSFSLFEFMGGVFTGSVAILSDAVHDMADALSIGISYFLEKKSKQQPDARYTYGYGRYSVLGSIVTTLVLLVGSAAVIYTAICRMLSTVAIKYDGMIVFAVIGICVNLAAALITREGKSLNQKAVNLHMLEDVLGWGVVLIGAVIMRLTDIRILDSVISVATASFIVVNAAKLLKEGVDLFLLKIPNGIDINQISRCIMEIDGVVDVYNIHIWSVDGQNHCGTMHIVANSTSRQIKEIIRIKLNEFGIKDVTLELEAQIESHSRA